MAPLYDAVTTRVFPKLKHDRLALKLNGKDDNLRRADFQALATTAGLRAGDAEGAVDEVVQRLRGALDGIAVPKAIHLSDETRQMTVEVLDLAAGGSKAWHRRCLSRPSTWYRHRHHALTPTGVAGRRFGTLQARRLLFHSLFDLVTRCHGRNSWVSAALAAP